MTLIEVLVGGMLTVLALGAVMFFVEASFKQTRAVSDKVGALDDTTRSFERMIREVRTATLVVQANPQLVELRRWVGESAASPHVIRYDCTGAGTVAGTRACTRSDVTAGQQPARVIDGLVNDDVFVSRAVADPAINPPIELKLALRVPGRANPIVLRGLASPRNCNTANHQVGGCER